MAYPGDGRLSVIYVRGSRFRYRQGGDDPFYGFNEGSVHIRVDGAGEPRLLQFENPLLRLITDEGYQLQVHGDQRAYLAGQDDGNVDANTIWVHRFTTCRHPHSVRVPRSSHWNPRPRTCSDSPS